MITIKVKIPSKIYAANKLKKNETGWLHKKSKTEFLKLINSIS